MRELTTGERHSWYRLRQWPCGHGNEYIPGPRGGMSRNVMCPTCKMKMNVIDPTADMPPDFDLGQMIYEPPGYVPPPDPKTPQTPSWRERLHNLLHAIRWF